MLVIKLTTLKRTRCGSFFMWSQCRSGRAVDLGVVQEMVVRKSSDSLLVCFTRGLVGIKYLVNDPDDQFRGQVSESGHCKSLKIAVDPFTMRSERWPREEADV
jgi:hypothetical protein